VCKKQEAAEVVNHTNDSVWENVAQRRKIARICTLFKSYTGERARRDTEDRLQRSCWLSSGDHDRKIRARKQRTDIGKYPSINRTINLWNQLPAEALATLSCKLQIFIKRVRKVIISENK
jgi:hypothetical protein